MLKIEQLQVGGYAEIKGLKARPEKNGLIGRLESFDESSGRWKVKVHGKDEELGVKPENLWAVNMNLKTDPVMKKISPEANVSKDKNANVSFDTCDVAFLSKSENSEACQESTSDLCVYVLGDSGLKMGALGIISIKSKIKSGMPTGHGLLLRGLTSIPSTLGYIEGVKLLNERTKEYVAVSNVHREAILLLCGAESLERLEKCKKLTISAWIQTGAKILPTSLPVQKLAYLHDWADMLPETPSGSDRAAYIEHATGRYFLRVVSQTIPDGDHISDENTKPLTQANDLSLINPDAVLLFGPIMIDWSARGCPPPRPRSPVMYSDDPAHLLVRTLEHLVAQAFMDLQPRAPPKNPFVWTGLCAVDGPEHASPSDLAARNDDDPQHLYDTGIEIEFDEGDEKAAMVYYKRAAAAGHAGGLSKVGRARLLGVGGEALDVDEGVKLIRRAAELGNAMAQCNMASCYLQRKLGKEKSDKELFEEAVHWYRQAVGKGEWLAEWNLGVLVMDGMGTPRDEVAGLALIRSASEQGEAGAHFHLARAYEAGRGGLSRDPARALELYQMAADEGFEPAIRVLRCGGLRVPR